MSNVIRLPTSQYSFPWRAVEGSLNLRTLPDTAGRHIQRSSEAALPVDSITCRFWYLWGWVVPGTDPPLIWRLTAFCFAFYHQISKKERRKEGKKERPRSHGRDRQVFITGSPWHTDIPIYGQLHQQFSAGLCFHTGATVQSALMDKTPELNHNICWELPVISQPINLFVFFSSFLFVFFLSNLTFCPAFHSVYRRARILSVHSPCCSIKIKLILKCREIASVAGPWRDSPERMSSVLAAGMVTYYKAHWMSAMS